jgi:hypothetical protein
MIETSALMTLQLNGCGINDRGYMELTRAASYSRTLRNLEVSENLIGPTGANWTATANRVFYCDMLDVAAGFKASAPFKKKFGDSSLSSVMDEMEAPEYGKSKNAGAQQDGTGRGADKMDFADDNSLEDFAEFEDTDLFDGEEDDADDEDGEDNDDDDTYFGAEGNSEYGGSIYADQTQEHRSEDGEDNGEEDDDEVKDDGTEKQELGNSGGPKEKKVSKFKSWFKSSKR